MRRIDRPKRQRKSVEDYDTWEEYEMDFDPARRAGRKSRVQSMNLDDFMQQTRIRNTYVSEPGFLSLYVRRTVPIGPMAKRYIGGKFIENVLDIANIEATKPGQGNWTALVNRIQEKYPDWTIYVENVLNSRFVEKLDKMGFLVVIPISEPPCFYLPGGNYLLKKDWPEGKIKNPIGRYSGTVLGESKK